MKMIREEAQVLVMFDKRNASPILLTSTQGTFRVNRTIKTWKERRNLRDCFIYLCQIDGRTDPLELRWETESNTWFIEKL